MKLGFMTAILPDLSLEEALRFAAEEGFECVEVMCWPTDASDKRRYAGVTHIDVNHFGAEEAEEVRRLSKQYGVEISGLGYYPNPLTADADERRTYVGHIRKLIEASARLGVGVVNTFVGRDPKRMVEEQWGDFEEVWNPLVELAEQQGVRIGIENCPMLFSSDEWPGGKNLAFSPEIWEEMFERIPSRSFGLNFDPSHLVWQQIDIDRALREFADRLVHVHLKDERIDDDLLYRRGVNGLGWHVPKIPGLGSIDWDSFFSSLMRAGWTGPLQRMDKERMNEVADKLLKRVGISKDIPATTPVRHLSGGERQAVSIARALHFDSELIILDEPTNNLGVEETQGVLRFVREARDSGHSSIFIAHNIHHVMQVVDRIVVLRRGRVVADDIDPKAMTVAEVERVITGFVAA